MLFYVLLLEMFWLSGLRARLHSRQLSTLPFSMVTPWSVQVGQNYFSTQPLAKGWPLLFLQKPTKNHIEWMDYDSCREIGSWSQSRGWWSGTSQRCITGVLHPANCGHTNILRWAAALNILLCDHGDQTGILRNNMTRYSMMIGSFGVSIPCPHPITLRWTHSNFILVNW